jgi:predicted nucleic acid-binding protein
MRWLFKDGSPLDLSYAAHARERSKADKFAAIASPIWPMEIMHVINRAHQRGFISAEAGKELIDIAQSYPLTFDHGGYINGWMSIYSLASHYKLTAYDASYLEIAMRLSIPIATLDQELIAAAEKAGVSIF